VTDHMVPPRGRPPRGFHIRGVLFDFDETLTAPGAIDFALIRRRIGCPDDRPILEFIDALGDGEERRRALEAVHDVEMAAAAGSGPNPGAEGLVRWLQEQGLPLAIQTRNSRASVERAFANFEHLSAADFRVLITRDDEVANKPAPDGVLQAAATMGVDPSEVLVVGDYVFDMQAGRSAGAVTALLDNGDSMASADLCDFTLHDIAEVRDIVSLGRPLPAGKVPSELLEAFLEELPHDDVSVRVPPRVGEDVTVVDTSPGRLISLGADPITFSAESPGAWALVVNANDIAVCGADPRWFLATVLLPVGTTASQVITLLEGLAQACLDLGVTLCGGHTEVTGAVNRVVVSGTMLGTFGDRGLIDKRDMEIGDAIVLTKRIAVEGTALLAGECGAGLREAGVTAEELSRALELRRRLDVMAEARVAAGVPGVHAMHDVTEGGLATAVAELAAAGEHSIGIDLDTVPVYDETRRICEALGVDPLGLIGSGSLLISVADDRVDELLGGLAQAGVEATRIGTALERTDAPEVFAWHGCSAPSEAAAAKCASAPWPVFAVDEVARVLGSDAPVC